MDDFERALATGLREHLDRAALRHEQLSIKMRRLGFGWTRNTVTQITTGRRGLSILEAGGICEALQVPLASLVDDKRVAASLRGDFGQWETVHAELDDEASVKAARSLGISRAEVERLARQLWGRSLEAERDYRCPPAVAGEPRSIQARRGHATRSLLAEIRQALVG